ncbi:unnamed protein product [Musa textilis]
MRRQRPNQTARSLGPSIPPDGLDKRGRLTTPVGSRRELRGAVPGQAGRAPRDLRTGRKRPGGRFGSIGRSKNASGIRRVGPRPPARLYLRLFLVAVVDVARGGVVRAHHPPGHDVRTARLGDYNNNQIKKI